MWVHTMDFRKSMGEREGENMSERMSFEYQEEELSIAKLYSNN